MSDLLVNSTIAGRQNQPSLGVAADGTYVVSWVTFAPDVSTMAVVAQRFSAAGEKLGAEIAVSAPVAFSSPANQAPEADVAVAPDGSFTVAWREGTNILVRRFDAAGAPRDSDPVPVASNGSELFGEPSLAMDAAGNFAVTWAGSVAGHGFGVQVQRFSAAGAKQGDVAVLPIGTSPAIAMAANGDYVLTWDSGLGLGGLEDGDGLGVYAQLFSANGVPKGAAFLVNTVIATWQEAPAVAMDAAGNFVIAWDSGDWNGPSLDGFRKAIAAQRFDAAGTPLGGEFRVNTTTWGDQRTPALTMDGSGFVVTWVSSGQDGSFLGIYAQRYSAAGVPQGPEFRVNLDALGPQNRPAVAMRPDGGFTVAWDTAGGFNDFRFSQTSGVAVGGDGSESGVYLRSFLADGRAAPVVLLDLDTAVAGAGRSIGFVPGAAPQAVLDERIAIEAPGLPFLSGATARLEARPDGTAAETLLLDAAAAAAATAAGLSVAWNATTGVLGISGSASVAAYESVLRGLSYANSAAAPSGADRVVAVQLTAPGGVQSQVARATLTDWGGTPSLALDLDAAVTGTGSQGLALTSEGAARVFGAEVSIGAVGVAGLTGATVLLGGRLNGTAESLALTTEAATAATAAGITASWNAATGLLTLSGAASAAAYEAALEGVRYAGPALAQAGTRTLSVEITGPGGTSASAAGTLLVDRSGGSEIAVPVSQFENLFGQEIAFDADGNLLLAWQGDGPDGDGTGVFAQRLDGNGKPLSAAIQLNQYATSSQSDPSFAVAPDGGFVAAWASNGQDGSGFGVYARRFDAAGAPLGNEFLVTNVTAGRQNEPSIAMDGAGNFTIAWTSTPTTATFADIFARRFAADGTALGDEFQVNSTTLDGQVNPVIAMKADGTAVIAWTSRVPNPVGGGTTSDIHAQRLAADGTPLGTEFVVNTTLTDSQSVPVVAMDAQGGFVIAWQSNQAITSDVFARRYAANGTALGDEFQVNSTAALNQTQPAIAMRPDGSFIISWVSSSQDGDGSGIYAQRYAANGTAVGGEFRLSGTTAGSQTVADIAVAPDGGFAAAWSLSTGTADLPLVVNFFNADGSAKAVDLDLSTPGSGFATSFAPGGAAARIADTDAAINPNITSPTPTPDPSFAGGIEALGGIGFTHATATLSGRSDGAAEFLYLGAGPAAGIDSSWDEASGTLTLRGPGGFGEFLAALQAVRYLNTDTTPTFGDRTVAVRFFGQPVATDIVTATIAVGNAAPTTIGLSSATAVENAAGAAIGTLTVTDPDAGQAHGFTLSDNRFEVVGGILKLKAGIALDYEAAAQVPLQVTATDPGGLGFTETFQILVTNLYETRHGTAGNDTLSGAERLSGLGGNDSLIGSAGHDVLNGGADADTMAGGAGNDTYVVNEAGDVVTEATNAGTDRISASISLALGANVENLSLLGLAGLAGTGNALDNRLDGNGGGNLLDGGLGNDSLSAGLGDDTLIGGAGNDLLNGGAGLDTFRYAAAAEGGDRIAGYAVADDTIEVSRSGFGGNLALGVLEASRFEAVSATATSAPGEGQFIWRQGPGTLLWDVDGSGAGAAQVIARFTGGVTLSASEIIIVA